MSYVWPHGRTVPAPAKRPVKTDEIFDTEHDFTVIAWRLGNEERVELTFGLPLFGYDRVTLSSGHIDAKRMLAIGRALTQVATASIIHNEIAEDKPCSSD